MYPGGVPPQSPGPGAPPQPYQPTWAGQPPGQRPRKRPPWGLIITLLVLGLVVLLVAGVFAVRMLLVSLSGQGGQSEESPNAGLLAGKVSWKKPGNPGDENVLSSVASGKVLVQVTRNRVLGLDKRDGEQSWKLSPPALSGADSTAFCGASRTARRGVAAISYGPTRQNRYSERLVTVTCSHLALVELSSGELRWRHGSANQDSGMMSGLTADRVVFRNGDNVAALRRTDGTTSWKYTAPEQGSCYVNDLYVSRSAVTLVESCVSEGRKRLVMLDPTTGRTHATVDLPQADTVSLLSGDPAVVEVSRGIGPEASELLFFDRSGKRTGSVPVQPSSERTLDTASIDGMIPRNEYHTVVTNGMLVISTTPRKVSKLRSENRIVAYELQGGERVWSSRLAPKTSIYPFAATSKGILAINNGTYENPPALLRLAFDDGTVTRLGPPAPTNEINAQDKTDLYWDGPQRRLCGVTLYSLDMQAFCMT
ncbi:PQQ-binding-like beta-propeller repeat protein [Actinopolyspora sp. H202]|uniref:outer membrane protein assembly factor BamB family protein n=1 Tax=Actinopolyspora sp. H202 TaxID=1500456 RepID=UPI003EE760B9